jgi:hypothetical protein
MNGRPEAGIGVIAALAALALAAPALASVVSDLEGARAAGALEDMERRGYVQTSNYAASAGRYSYWWNGSTRSCIRLLTSDGRIAATKTVTASDCGQSPARSGGQDAAAGVIAGAAVLAGVAALAHKSHHRDDQEWDDSTSYADFERGHRDGLLGHAYHDYSNSARYRDGYESGVRERGYQSGYRGSSYFRGGYESHVSLSDLVYQDRGTAERELRSRGFRQVGGYDRPEGGHSDTWWNGGTRQCVSLNARRGQVEAIQDIYEGHCQ